MQYDHTLSEKNRWKILIFHDEKYFQNLRSEKNWQNFENFPNFFSKFQNFHFSNWFSEEKFSRKMSRKIFFETKKIEIFSSESQFEKWKFRNFEKKIRKNLENFNNKKIRWKKFPTTNNSRFFSVMYSDRKFPQDSKNRT